MEISSQTTKITRVPDGVLAFLEKTIPMGRLHMRPSSVVSQTWQYPQSLVLRVPVSNPSEKASLAVEDYYKMGSRLPFPGRLAPYPYFHRCIYQGW